MLNAFSLTLSILLILSKFLRVGGAEIYDRGGRSESQESEKV